MLHKDTLELIQATARKAQAVEVVEKLTTDRAWYVRVGDKLEKVDRPPTLRDHQLSSLADLIHFARDWAGLEPGEGRDAFPIACWHDDGWVRLVLDDADRRDVARYELVPSEPMMALADLQKTRPAFDQKTLLHFLRFRLDAEAAIVQRFRRLDWERWESTSEDRQRTKESLGRSIDAKVKGLDELPDVLTFPVPVYAPPEDFTARVECAVELDTLNQRILIVPRPGQLDLAFAGAQAVIRSRLEEGLGDLPNCAIYYGKP